MLAQAEVFINMQNLHIDFPDFGQWENPRFMKVDDAAGFAAKSGAAFGDRASERFKLSSLALWVADSLASGLCIAC
jgi:hypothetical protein